MKLTPFQKEFRKVFLDGLKSHLKFLERMALPGVAFTTEQEQTIRNLIGDGDVVGAQKVILSEIEKWDKEQP